RGWKYSTSTAIVYVITYANSHERSLSEAQRPASAARLVRVRCKRLLGKSVDSLKVADSQTSPLVSISN
ncbi:MAG: hypothetical protein O9972_16335, partial [Burkholderiales bacterium]|nr:hypothetical protein [Burkholderiales bacterium]